MKWQVCIASAADIESKSWQYVEIVPVSYMVGMSEVYISMFLCNYSEKVVNAYGDSERRRENEWKKLNVNYIFLHWTCIVMMKSAQ